MGICLSAKIKAESPCHTGVNSKPVSTDGTDLSGSMSKGSSVSLPRSEGEILQSPNLKSFSFSDLKMATRNFRPDSVLEKVDLVRFSRVGWTRALTRQQNQGPVSSLL